MVLLPYQQRVVEEREQLQEKLTKLREFIETPMFEALSIMEKARLRRQRDIMREYRLILDVRIEAWIEAWG